MKTIIILIAIGWFFIFNSNPVKAQNLGNILQNQVLEVGYKAHINASDLQIKRLTAVVCGDSVLFTLTYSSKKNRFLCFFNPPQGRIFKYYNTDGIKKNDTIASFYVKKDIFKKVDAITMRFSTTNWFKRDGNFIFLDRYFLKGLVNPALKKSGVLLTLYEHHKNITSFTEFQDVRWDTLTSMEDILTSEKIATLIYNKDSKFGKHSSDAEQIMEKGKNPGLGVRSLHEQGITGKGICVAIIDQNLPGKHPEYAGNIAKYKDFGCKQSKNKGSMHGPGVLSLLVGNTIGTAPDAQVYFAATPSWKLDSKYSAKALLWIIKENRRLPKENKIRVVSMSGTPSGPGSPFKKNNEQWDKAVKIAEEEGIIVLDCTKDHGLVGPCYYDLSVPDDVTKCKAGWPYKAIKDTSVSSMQKIYAPCSYRTLAEEYKKGTNSYQYYGAGGLSWSIPYVAGVMAMGWQVKPELTGKEMFNILTKTAFTNSQGYKIIDPVAFINYLQQMK